jgi:hypothetical protein
LFIFNIFSMDFGGMTAGWQSGDKRLRIAANKVCDMP